jgi:hypothetical protein
MARAARWHGRPIGFSVGPGTYRKKRELLHRIQIQESKKIITKTYEIECITHEGNTNESIGSGWLGWSREGGMRQPVIARIDYLGNGVGDQRGVYP